MDFLTMEKSLEADINQIKIETEQVKRQVVKIDKFNAEVKKENIQM